MHGWRLLPGKIYLPFKTVKNAKIADLILSINSSNMTKMIFCKIKNKMKYHSDSKIWRHFSPATMAGYPKLKCFFSAYRYFCITYCSNRRLTTIEFKELLHLMPDFFGGGFALITVF